MSDKKTHIDPDYIEKTIKNMSSRYSRRVGTREREAHAEYVNEAYAAGYLDEQELGQRRDKIMEAKYSSDLESMVSDLPAYAELRGRELTPKNVSKHTFGLVKFYTKDHMVLGPLMSLVLGLLIAITPGVSFASLKLTNMFPFSLIMAFTIVIGASMTLFSFMRLMYVAFEEM